MTSIAKSHDHLAEIRRTLQLAAPVMFGQVAVFSMNFIDTVMAGRLPQKDIALAGLGIGGALWSAFMVFLIGVLMAVQPSVAQLDGAGRPVEAGRVVRQALWIALAVAVPFWALSFFSEGLLLLVHIDPSIIPTAAGYLRALSWGAPGICLVFLLRFFSEGAGHTMPTMAYGIAGALLNIPFNYVLMFGKLGFPALGAVGCGYATAAIIWIQVIFLMLYMHRHRFYRPFQLFSHWDAPHWPDIRVLLHLGIPIAISMTLETSLFVAAALLIGQLGALPSAAHLIAINFSALLFMVPLGLSTAISIRVGNAIGRGDPAFARYVGLIGLSIALATQSLNMLLMFVFPGLIISLYTNDAAVSAVAINLLFFAAVFQLPDGIQICAAGALRGLKDTRLPMLYNLIAYWAIGLSLGYYLTFHVGLGPKGMWIGMIAGLSVGASLLASRFVRQSGRMILNH